MANTATSPAAAGSMETSYYSMLFMIRPQRPISDVEDLEATLKQLVKKHGIRISDPIRDYDRLNRGLITVSQFKSAVGGIKFPKFQLTDAMLDLLANKYKSVSSDGVEWFQYRPFVHLMEGASLSEPATPAAAQTQTATNPRVEAVLNKIRAVIATRAILLKPIFKDFDRVYKGTYQTGHITRERFSRALTTLSIRFTPEEMQLLYEKYDDRNDREVNYVLFCKDVDPIYTPE